MFRLIKLGMALAAFAAIAWFGTTVKLGSRTLFQHLRAIGQTQASQDLVDGTKQAAEPLVDGVRRRLVSAHDTPPARAAGTDAGAAPSERVSAGDRHRLRRLIRDVDR